MLYKRFKLKLFNNKCVMSTKAQWCISHHHFTFTFYRILLLWGKKWGEMNIKPLNISNKKCRWNSIKRYVYCTISMGDFYWPITQYRGRWKVRFSWRRTTILLQYEEQILISSLQNCKIMFFGDCCFCFTSYHNVTCFIRRKKLKKLGCKELLL